MTQTYVILDGLQDHDTSRALSARWAGAGYANAVDPAGQCARIGIKEQAGPTDAADVSFDERDLDRIAAIARSLGLAVRDRVGSGFEPGVGLEPLRANMEKEYRGRLAVALMFGLPGIVLHYIGPTLAGGVVGARSLAYPWLIEGLLVTWGCIAGGWPILWQGLLSLARRRTSGDALTTLIVLGAWGPSVIGVASLAFTPDPWFVGIRGGGGWLGYVGGPAFHAAMVAMTLAVMQRWLVYRFGAGLGGRGTLMIPRWHGLVGVWFLLSLAILLICGWHWGLAVAMLLPPMAGLGAVNPWSPGWSGVLPVFGFAGLLLLGPGVVGLPVGDVAIEIAAGFGLMMTAVFAMGWRAWGRHGS